MRQMHHWAADVFLGAIVVHMARIFFTGAFRKPRETNWIIGITMLILGILNGFIGYSLPDDLISGTGLRIAYSIMLSIPFVGTYLASFLFGGNFPGHIDHPAVLHHPRADHPGHHRRPAGAHLGLLVRQKHTQFPGKGRTEHNVVGTPMFPTFMAKTTGFLLMVAGVLRPAGRAWPRSTRSGSSAPTSPTRSPTPSSRTGTWAGWTGRCASCPPGSGPAWGHTIPWEVFLPAVVFPGLIFNICFVWPIIERMFTKDNEMHNLLDRPRDRPKRTAAGAAMIALLFTLFGASSTDVLANFFHVSLNEVLWFFRIAVVVVPIIVGLRHVADLSRDAGRPRHRQAQAGPGGHRVRPRASTAPPPPSPAPATTSPSSSPSRSRSRSTSSRAPSAPGPPRGTAAKGPASAGSAADRRGLQRQ